MLEWLLVVAPVAFSAFVFTMAIGSAPVDIALQHITTPEFLEQQGYAPDALDDIIERKISAIVDGAASLQAPRTIEVGTPETTINAFADITGLVASVRAAQRFLGLVDYIAEVHFLADEVISGTVRLSDTNSWEFQADQDESLLATLRIRDSDTLEIVAFEELAAEFPDLDRLLDQIAREIVGFVDPYTLALYLYNEAVRDPSDDIRLADVVDHLRRAMPLVQDKDRHWYYNLLCRISIEIEDLDLAIEYCTEAVRWQPAFASAHVNWGAALARLGRQPAALAHYQTALKLQPDLAVARVNLAELLLEQRMFEDALAQLEAARAVAPEFARIYQLRAAIYRQVGVSELAQGARLRADVARTRQPRQSFYEAL